MDAFAASSHAKAVAAQAAGKFVGEIVPMEGQEKDGSAVTHDSDQGVRPATTAAKLSELDTLVTQGFCPPPMRPAGASPRGTRARSVTAPPRS